MERREASERFWGGTLMMFKGVVKWKRREAGWEPEVIQWRSTLST